MVRKEYDVMAAGYLCADLTPVFPGRKKVPVNRLLQPGKLVEVGELSVSLGGTVPNTGLALRRFGNRVYLNGLTGSDVLGDMARGILEKNGTHPGIRTIPDCGTAYGIVLAPPGADRIFLESPGCNAIFSARHIDYRAARDSRLFHFGYPPLMNRLLAHSGRELVSIFKRVRRTGTATSLDMAMPDPRSSAGRADWKGILVRLLPLVDIFVPSIEEIIYMLKRGTYTRLNRTADMVEAVPETLFRTLGKQLVGMGTPVVLLKAGHRGLYLRTGDIGPLTDRTGLPLAPDSWSNRELWIPCFRIRKGRIKNTCGAGDAAIAAFLSAILRGTAIEEAGRYAALAGRDNLYGTDALEGLRGWESMTRALMVKGRRGTAPPVFENFTYNNGTAVYNARK